MNAHIKLDRASSVAIYQQISEQIKDRIADGRLPAGSRLPTVRRLAADLGVTRLTVQNAYSDLQAAGWVEATVGRGTFVSENVRRQNGTPSVGAQLTPDAVISDILQLNQVVGLRSLASASPDPRLFPADEFWQALAESQGDLVSVISYGSTQGDPALRVELSEMLREREIVASPDDILVVAGVTQGLSLVAQALAQPGDTVLVEQPTYLGLLHTLKAHDLQAVAVERDVEGPLPDMVERLAIQRRPRFFYIVPNFQNPTGECLSAGRRVELLALAERYGFSIVEDDIYSRLAYDGPAPTPLKAIDPSDLVVHVGSFSKVLMPGLRLGYVVAPPAVQRRLLSLRRASDLCSPPLLQHALCRFLRGGGLRRHMRRVLPIYRERRDSAMSALERSMPADVQWTRPGGGFCCWLSLPYRASGTISTDGLFDDLQQAALRRGWAFVPGEVFLTQPGPQKHLRICFGGQSPDAVRTGIDTLAELIRERMAAGRRVENAPANWMPLV